MKSTSDTTPDFQFNFNSKVVLVTGAGGGIGRAIAAAFGHSGAAVAAHYHNNQTGTGELVRQLSDNSQKAEAFQADLCQEQAVEQLIARVIAHFGRLDILINNAGIYPVATLVEMSATEWDTMMDTNLRSVFLCTRYAGATMIDQGMGGAIINITSVEACQPANGHAHYSTSKAAVWMLTRASANELGPHGIRVNAIAPGLIQREGLEQDWPEGVARYRQAAPLGTLGQPEDVANACLFLSSPAAQWITGSSLSVDGGISNHPFT